MPNENNLLADCKTQRTFFQPRISVEDARKIYYQRLQPALYIEGDILLQSFDILAGDLKIDPQKLARVNNRKGLITSQTFFGWLIIFSTDLEMILKDKFVRN